MRMIRLALFAALSRMKHEGHARSSTLCIRFRAAVHEDLLWQLASEYGVADLIEVCPAVPYLAALEEMCLADGLLILQAGDCNDQIPGKVYEYLRANRPILCLADPRGDTSRLVTDAGIGFTADLSDSPAIESVLRSFLEALNHGSADVPKPSSIANASRSRRTEQLAGFLEQLIH